MQNPSSYQPMKELNFDDGSHRGAFVAVPVHALDCPMRVGCRGRGEVEGNPIHFMPDPSRVRPDACLPVCCTLPAPCSFVGYLCVKRCCCCCQTQTGNTEKHVIGIFQKLCTPCCSVLPLMKKNVEGLVRPAHHFVRRKEDGSYEHITREEYEKGLAIAGDIPPFSGQWRSADGGGLSKEFPYLGQGGRAYAVSVPNRPAAARMAQLPPAEVIFDRLFSRPSGSFTRDPCGANALLVYGALMVTHEFFRTDEGRGEDGDGIERPWVNVNSSELDLQVLYGFNKERQSAVRTHSGGRLKDDALGDTGRLAALPEVAAIIGLFRSEHNFIADQLARIYPDRFGAEAGNGADEACFQQPAP